MEEAAGDPVKKTQLIKDIVGSIARIPDPIKRSLYVKECAFVMGVEEPILVEETNRTVTQLLGKKRQQRQRGEARAEKAQREQFLKPVNPGQEEGTASKSLSSRQEGIELQEKEIIRVLIAHWGKMFDQEEQLTVEAYILGNLEEVIDDFRNELYSRILQECLQKLVNKEALSTSFFVNHPDQEISQLAIGLIHSPYEYSPNWMNIHDLPLQSQLEPERNFKQESISVVYMYKIRKADQMMVENQERIRKAQEEKDEAEMMNLLRVQQKLKQMRNDLAAQFKTVVLK